jgi:hypothetical protein
VLRTSSSHCLIRDTSFCFFSRHSPSLFDKRRKRYCIYPCYRCVRISSTAWSNYPLSFFAKHILHRFITSLFLASCATHDFTVTITDLHLNYIQKSSAEKKERKWSSFTFFLTISIQKPLFPENVQCCEWYLFKYSN